MELCFEEVTVQVPSSGTVILDAVSGRLAPGQLLAILGSGKTTLLNFLAGRTQDLTASGRVLLAGADFSNAVRKRISGYVTQSDHLLGFLTVRETLLFTARFRRRDLSAQGRRDLVERILRELNLRNVADSRVGDDVHRGISGGEKRRLSVGVQLVTDPGLLFVDEPTTGLDATMAHNVMKLLVKLACHGRMVISTIHQPRSDIFKLFDRIMLLSRGEVVYFGPAKSLVNHFSSIGFHCPVYANPADFALDTIMVDTRTEELERLTRQRLEYMKARFVEDGVLASVDLEEGPGDQLREELFRTLPDGDPSSVEDEESPSGELINGVKLEAAEGEGEEGKQQREEEGQEDEDEEQQHLEQRFSFADELGGNSAVSKERKAPFWVATFLIAQRLWLFLARDFVGFSSRVLAVGFFGFLLFFFLNQVSNSQTGAQNRVGISYELVSGPFFVGILTSVTLFPTQRDIFYRERQDSTYPVSSFLAGYTLHALPVDFLGSIVFSLVGIMAIGFRADASTFFQAVTVSFSSLSTGESIGLLFLSIFSDVNVAEKVASLLASILMVLTGFLRTSGSLPIIFEILNYISPSAYGAQVLFVNEVRDRTFTCTAQEQLQDGSCPIPTGQALLDIYGFRTDTVTRSLILSVVLMVVYRAAVYLPLRFKKKTIAA